jgi:hypothetical protein
MQDTDRRVSTRKPLPIAVYLVVDGIRHPGTLRDLSMAGAGFSDPVLAVRLALKQEQEAILEIPPDSGDDQPLRLPGRVVHAVGGLRPRLGLKFDTMESEKARRLIERLGRATAASQPTSSGKPAATATTSGAAELNFVLIEPREGEKKERAYVTTLLVAAVIIALFLFLLLMLSRITL